MRMRRLVLAFAAPALAGRSHVLASGMAALAKCRAITCQGRRCVWLTPVRRFDRCPPIRACIKPAVPARQEPAAEWVVLAWAGMGGGMDGGMGPVPAGFVPHGSGRGPSYDNAQMPGYAWPSYASYPNYAALTYPQQYSPTAWPYIGPFYPYPQVPLAWRKVSLEWDDGWWFLDFSAHNSSH